MFAVVNHLLQLVAKFISMLLTQAAKAAGDQVQAANGGQIPPYPGLDRRIPSSAKLADMSSQAEWVSGHQQPGKSLAKAFERMYTLPPSVEGVLPVKRDMLVSLRRCTSM